MSAIAGNASGKRVDSHQHFWEYDESQYPWIQKDWPIRKSFLPQDLEPLLKGLGFDACVAVQARQSHEETRWLLALAERHPFVAGVVGWVDLRSEQLRNELMQLRHEKLVGVRHVAQDEPDDRFLVGKEFTRGIACLKEFDLAYDLLIFPRQLPAAIELAGMFPEQRFVLDHMAKPPIRDGDSEFWRSQIQDLSARRNVYCKLSGMVTEADWRKWKKSDFEPFLETIWEVFGEDRLMVGSDWPVCLLAGEYSEVMSIVIDYLSGFSDAVKEKVLGGNARRFYKLKF